MSNRITQLSIEKLKGLKNLNISFEDKNVTAIFGENGSGKSTILHVLACFYQGIVPGSETNYFTRFFKRIGAAAWEGSKMTASFDLGGSSKTIVYAKNADRWTPRNTQRLKRNTYYIGINSCVPDIEKEIVTRTCFQMLPGSPVANRDLIIAEASRIMGRMYVDFSKPKYANRSYMRVGLHTGTEYTSLSMGAGEQRLFTILDRLISAPIGSLILIDELDLTLHTVALNRLLDTMVRLSNERDLQVVFTSHREELIRRKDINIRHIWKPANQDDTLCLDRTTPMCMYRLNGLIEKTYEVYVEDDMAEAIVKAVLRDEQILDFVKVYKFGDALNGFSVAAGLHIQGTLSDNQLILIDGDVYTTEAEREKAIKKRFSGNEAGKDHVRSEALRRIKQFNLPVGEHPEHYLWTMLKTKQGSLAEFANRIDPLQGDKHCYIYEIFKLQGESREIFLKDLVDTLKTDAAWAQYVSEVQIWAHAKKQELGLAR